MDLEVVEWNDSQAPTEAELRARLESEGYQVFSWNDAAGTVYEPHRHEHDESLWIVSGQMTFGVAGDDYALGPGDRLMLPGGTVHSAVAGPQGAAYLVGQRD